MRILSLVLVVSVMGCAAGPEYQPPAANLSADWRNAPDSGEPEADWWHGFGSPTLDRLEAEALANNLDLEAAVARVDQARGTLRGADGALLPSAVIEAQAGKTRQSLNSGLGRLSRVAPSFARTVDVGQLDIAASWDIDFAGGLTRRRESAAAGVEDAEARFDAARVAIAADVADAYVALRGGQAQLAAARRQASLLGELRGIAAVRVAVKAAAPDELDRARAATEDADALLPPLEAFVDGQRNRIAVLLGRDPSQPVTELLDAEDVLTPPDPAAGHPADVIRRRADVRAAEARLVAANAQIGAALAEYYPHVSLSALVGQFTNGFATFTAANSTAVQGVAGLRWRLFDFVRIDGEVQSARGRERESRAAYAQAVLLATESVETAFSQWSAARDRALHLARGREALVAAAASAEAAFRTGEVSRETWVAAGRAVARLDIDEAAAQRDVARSVVACERALGVAPAASRTNPSPPDRPGTN